MNFQITLELIIVLADLWITLGIWYRIHWKQ